MGTNTPIRNFYKPDTGEDGWGSAVTAIFDEIDGDINVQGLIQIYDTTNSGISFTTGTHADPGVATINLGTYDLTLPDGTVTISSGELTLLAGNINVSDDVQVDGELIAEYLTIGSSFVGPYSEEVVADPPSQSDLDAAFPDGDTEGFVGVLDDDADGTDVWLCAFTINGWYTVQLTVAPA